MNKMQLNRKKIYTIGGGLLIVGLCFLGIAHAQTRNNPVQKIGSTEVVKEKKGNNKDNEKNQNTNHKAQSSVGTKEHVEPKPKESIEKNKVPLNEKNKNSSNFSPSLSKPIEKPSEHTHQWVEQFKIVHHESKGHYENILVSDKWVEYKPIYDYVAHDICNVCHFDLTANNVAPWVHAEAHMLNGEAGGHHTEVVEVQVGKEIIEHPAVYDKKWVVDVLAKDEKVSAGFKCDCGATR